jgi:hypothetical protein
LFSKVAPAKADEFFDGLAEGSMLPLTSPILKLRNLLLKDRGSKKLSMSDHELIAITIKAWNAFYSDQAVTTLKWQKTGPRKEAFRAFRN